MAEQKAGGYSTKYRFTGKEVDEETGLYYFGARYYDPRISLWYGVDPLANKFADWNPYNYTLNNPIRLVDPDGAAPGDPMIGFGFGFRTNFAGGYSASISVGASYRSGGVMGGVNVAANFYNYGLGTSHGTTGSYSGQRDLAISASMTFGGGTGSPLPLNTFNNNSSTGVMNSFGGSGTIGSNFVFNSSGRNQRVGYAGGKIGDVGLNFYNDVIPGLGDGNDQWWTGGGSLQIGGKNGTATLGTDVFTGSRLGLNKGGDWLSTPGNPAGGRFGTYAQDDSNQQLNNGQTMLILQGVNGLKIGGRNAGKNHMYSQDAIHNYFSKNKLFHSTANGE